MPSVPEPDGCRLTIPVGPGDATHHRPRPAGREDAGRDPRRVRPRLRPVDPGDAVQARDRPDRLDRAGSVASGWPGHGRMGCFPLEPTGASRTDRDRRGGRPRPRAQLRRSVAAGARADGRHGGTGVSWVVLLAAAVLAGVAAGGVLRPFGSPRRAVLELLADPLEDERASLLRSLRELEEERARGELSDATYRSLRPVTELEEAPGPGAGCYRPS